MAIIGQIVDLVPAERCYPRSETSRGRFLDSVALIAASVMPKKIAAGAEAVALDVKVGDGALTKSLRNAQILAEAMVELGTRAWPRRRMSS